MQVHMYMYQELVLALTFALGLTLTLTIALGKWLSVVVPQSVIWYRQSSKLERLASTAGFLLLPALSGASRC